MVESFWDVLKKKAHLFDENIIIGVVDVKALVIFSPKVGDVAPVVTTATI